MELKSNCYRPLVTRNPPCKRVHTLCADRTTGARSVQPAYFLPSDFGTGVTASAYAWLYTAST